MSRFGFLLRGIISFAVLGLGIAPASSAELGKQYLFNAEAITDFSLSPQQHLWFMSKNRFMETELVEGQWTSRRFIVPEDSHLESKLIYDFAVTEHHLWTIERDKVVVSELSATQPYLKNPQELTLPRETSEHVDMVSALDYSGVVTNVDSGIYVLNLKNNQISMQELNPDSCVRPKNIQMTAQWLVVECDNSTIVVYQSTEQGYEFLHSLSSRFIFINPDQASLTVYNSEQYKISTLSLATLTEISSVPGVRGVYQHSNNSLVLAEKTDPLTSVTNRVLLRLNAEGALEEELKFASQNFSVGLVDYASFSSFLFEAGDKIFWGFDHWLKNAETGLYEFRGNDWQYKLGLTATGFMSYPETNTFISGSVGKQIWFAEQSEMPTLQGYAQLMTSDYQAIDIQRAAVHQQKLWLVGADYSTTYLALWTSGQQFKQIQIPFERAIEAIESVTYMQSTDSIIIYSKNHDFIECQNASNLESAAQCRTLASPGDIESIVMTKNGALIYQNRSEQNAELDAVMYDLTTAGFQEHWRLRLDGDYASNPSMLYAPEHDIVLGYKGHIVLSGAQQGTLVQTPVSPFLTDSCNFLGSMDVLCGFAAINLFRFNQNFNLALEITPVDETSPFRQGNMLHSEPSGHVLIMKDGAVTWHSLDLPSVSFTEKEFVTEALQDQHIRLDLSEHLTPLNGLSIFHEEISVPSVAPALLAANRLSDSRWEFNTKNELAVHNPLFHLVFHFSNELWTMHFGYGFALHNVNDAPTVRAGQFVNNLDIGEDYILDFSDVFQDIDGDPLVYKTSTLPAGFTFNEGSILVTPVTAGSYQFTVTATDPSGTSATATFSGSIKVKVEVNPEGAPGGGSAGIWALTLLMALWIGRSNRLKRIRK